MPVGYYACGLLCLWATMPVGYRACRVERLWLHALKDSAEAVEPCFEAR